MKTDLSIYNNSHYRIGAGFLKRFLWYWANVLIFKSAFPAGSALKCLILRMFGAKVGRGVVIKPFVNIKYPWKLDIGSHVWIGEGAWIDNLDRVRLSDHCCISQGALLLCGNHDYKKPSFDLITAPIILEEGVWIGAKSIVCPGVTCRSHSVLAVNSVANRDLEPYSIYQGNPALKVKSRIIL
jgi:putative colanic acid biosynthesis acetyltransferase WcaF